MSVLAHPLERGTGKMWKRKKGCPYRGLPIQIMVFGKSHNLEGFRITFLSAL